MGTLELRQMTQIQPSLLFAYIQVFYQTFTDLNDKLNSARKYLKQLIFATIIMVLSDLVLFLIQHTFEQPAIIMK